MLRSASSRSWLQLAGVGGYVILIMTTLLGLPSLRAQSTPAVTPVASKLTVSPSSLDFGIQIVLAPDAVTSNSKNVTLSVAKGQAQPVTIVSLLPSDPQFIVQPNSCAVIQPGVPCTVPIAFKPNGLRKRSGVLLISSNASNDDGGLSVKLAGNGKKGLLTVQPRSLSFPLLQVGAPPTAGKSVTLTNKNSLPIILSKISSSNPDVFLLDNNCPAMLQPSAQCTFSVSFQADRNGSMGGKIFIADNAAGPDEVGVSGSGKGSPTATRTSTPTRTATPSPTKVPGTFPMRAVPVIH